MTLQLADAKSTVSGLLSKEMASVNAELQAALDSNDNVRALSLNGLRSKCTFDQMRVNAATIAAIDGDAMTLALLDELEDACDHLDDILENSNSTTKWIADAADGCDKIFSAFAKIANF